MPSRSKAICDCVYAVAVVGPKGDLAVLYFARSQWVGPPLALVDFEVDVVTAEVWREVATRLDGLSALWGARYPSPGLWVESEALLAAAFEAGTAATLLPPHICVKAAWQELCIAAMVQVRSGRVKVADTVFDKRESLGEAVAFGALKVDGGAERGDDATVPAMAYGIAIGLDLATAKLAQRARAA
jgi:hypothetical protein